LHPRVEGAAAERLHHGHLVEAQRDLRSGLCRRAAAAACDASVCQSLQVAKRHFFGKVVSLRIKSLPVYTLSNYTILYVQLTVQFTF
jgi:hypothetical protein